MQTVSDMRKRYDAQRRTIPFCDQPQFGKGGLTLGYGTVLVSDKTVERGYRCDDNERVTALLSTTYDRRIAPPVLKSIKRAVDRWRDGDGVLAHIELAFAHLPRIEAEDEAFRLFVAELVLADGHSPRDLLRGLGFDLDLEKYDDNQPRVPAGNGRSSGRWGPGSGSNALVGLTAAAARGAGRSFLVDAAPAIVRALAAFAARFSTPTAVLGALFIPTPNSGGVTEGTLPDAPTIRFRRDGPAGMLRLAMTADDGSETIVRAQNRRGIYVDVATDEPLGRDFGDQFYLDLAAVQAAFAPREKEKPAAAISEPQLCPAPQPDTPHGTKVHLLDYEDDVHARVNPLLPIPRGFAVRIVDPLTGEDQFPDDCFRYAGDLVDGNMKPGDFADAKGEEYASLLRNPWFGESVMAKLIDQATRHLRAAKARGAGLKIYFAEQEAADLVRREFAKNPKLKDVVISVLKPSKSK